jgi:hypothetical protein
MVDPIGDLIVDLLARSKTIQKIDEKVPSGFFVIIAIAMLILVVALTLAITGGKVKQ